MKKGVLGLSLVLSLSLAPAYSATPPKAGSLCSKQGITKTYKGKIFKCKKVRGKLVWSKGKVAKEAAPVASPSAMPSPSPSPSPSISPSSTPTPIPTPTPMQSASVKPVCTGLSENRSGKFIINLQMMDPFDTNRYLNGGGIYLRVGLNWNYFAADFNGKIEINVDPGQYEISTLPPLRAEFYLDRNSYLLNISGDGKFNIEDSEFAGNACRIYSKISSTGKERLALVKSANYKNVISPVDVEKPTNTIKYIAPISNRFSNNIELDLYPWESKHLVLLTLSNNYDPKLVGRYLRALDLAYEIYDDITGQFPKYTTKNSPWSRMVNGKAAIAEIPDINGIDSAKWISCGGNACTAPSTFGIEVRWQVLESTLWMLEHLDVYDHTNFYELGRTFWPQNTCASKISLRTSDPTLTGFAVLMRYVVIKEIGLSLGSDDAESGDSYYARLIGVENRFASNPELNLSNVFQSGRKIENLDGNAIWASLMTYLGSNYGGTKFYKKFFSSCSSLIEPATDLIAIENWKLLAEYAAGRELSAVFNSRWKLSGSK